MTRQLRLLDPTTVDWRLDDHTRAVGRAGVARARAALAAARAARHVTDAADTPLATPEPRRHAA
ncbi:MAG: hypothetical protein FJW83_03370 [Actinobacteria bacterium]|nr:hypothetical protein [Actinomycetota bacterium]